MKFRLGDGEAIASAAVIEAAGNALVCAQAVSIAIGFLPMSKQVIHITAFAEPIPTVRRHLGAMNVGIYCHCGRFVAFSAAEPGQSAVDVEFAAAQPILVACPYCKRVEHRRVEELHQLLLTKRNKRRLS